MNRRDFVKTSASIAAMAWLGEWEKAFAAGKTDKMVGKNLKAWKKGQFQVHFIYTGVCESMFLIFPDGTSMLLDCGDFDALARGKKAVPVLPSTERHSGEWIARYVERVNPKGKDVDYMMLSHYHDDHGGSDNFFAEERTFNGQPYRLSGFSQAAEFLNFGKAFDRCWPEYNDPLPLTDKDSSKMLTHMSRFYDYAQKVKGMKMEKFRLGETNQIVQLYHPEKFNDFSIRNICANGRLATPEGKIIDLYKERIEKTHPKSLNENGMSLGMIISYGDFRFYTAGDFSDKWRLEDGTMYETENAMADVCGTAHVAKVNHHGHNSMPEKLVKALRSQVYVSCVWDQLHNLDHVMARLADRNLYPSQRVICPGIMPKERRETDSTKAWMKDVPEALYDGCHMVLTVEPGGKEYSMTMLSAANESMKVKSVLRFKTTPL